MTILLYSLLFIFIFIEVPLVILMKYLLNHTTFDPKVSQMRKILFIFVFAKALFIFAQIILVFFSLFKTPVATPFIIWSYSLSAGLLALVDWWGFFELKKIIN